MPVLKHSGNIFRCHCCGKRQIVQGRDVWHLTQINTNDPHYYLVCDPCYPAYLEAQGHEAMERLGEADQEIAQPKPRKPQPVM